MNLLRKWLSTSKMLVNSIKEKGRVMEFDSKKLLKDKRVTEEITRHKWIESEIAGYDIGFEKASDDWIENYAASWIAYHDPQLKHFGKTSSTKTHKAK